MVGFLRIRVKVLTSFTCIFSPGGGFSFGEMLDRGTFRLFCNQAGMMADGHPVARRLRVVRKLTKLPAIIGVITGIVGFWTMLLV